MDELDELVVCVDQGDLPGVEGVQYSTAVHGIRPGSLAPGAAQPCSDSQGLPGHGHCGGCQRPRDCLGAATGTGAAHALLLHLASQGGGHGPGALRGQVLGALATPHPQVALVCQNTSQHSVS